MEKLGVVTKRFELGDTVEIVPLQVYGRVVAKCIHLYEMDAYSVEYVNKAGDLEYKWFYMELLNTAGANDLQGLSKH